MSALAVILASLAVIIIGLAIFGVKVAGFVLAKADEPPLLERSTPRSLNDLRWWNRAGSDYILCLEDDSRFRGWIHGNWYRLSTTSSPTAVTPASDLEDLLNSHAQRIEWNAPEDDISERFEYYIVRWYPQGVYDGDEVEWRVVLKNGTICQRDMHGDWWELVGTRNRFAEDALTEALTRQLPRISDEYKAQQQQLADVCQ